MEDLKNPEKLLRKTPWYETFSDEISQLYNISQMIYQLERKPFWRRTLQSNVMDFNQSHLLPSLQKNDPTQTNQEQLQRSKISALSTVE